MFQNDKPYTLDSVVRLAIAAGLLWGAVLLLDALSDVLLPFAAALALAYFINPLVEYVARLVKNRSAAVGLTITTLIALISTALWLTVPMLIREVTRTGKLLTAVVNDSTIAKRAMEYLPPDLWQAIVDLAKQPDIRDMLTEAGFLNTVQGAAKKILPGLWNVVSGTADTMLALAGLAIILLYLIFLLADFEKLKNWNSKLPKSWRQPAEEFSEEFTGAVDRYFRTQAFIALTVGILFSTGFLIIDVPLAVLLGLFIGLLNMVPYLQTIGLIPAFLLAGLDAIATGGHFWGSIGGVALVFIIVQSLQDGFLVPKLQGDSLGLSPWMILLSLSVWGKLLGFLGLVLALPLTCLALAYYRRKVLAAG